MKYHEMFVGSSPMHLTKSVDYAIIMDGEIEMHLDDGSVAILGKGHVPSLASLLTRSGDIVIQRGTMHRWIKVKGEKAVKMLVCLVDGGIHPVDDGVYSPQRNLRFQESAFLSRMTLSRNKAR